MRGSVPARSLHGDSRFEDLVEKRRRRTARGRPVTYFMKESRNDRICR